MTVIPEWVRGKMVEGQTDESIAYGSELLGGDPNAIGDEAQWEDTLSRLAMFRLASLNLIPFITVEEAAEIDALGADLMGALACKAGSRHSRQAHMLLMLELGETVPLFARLLEDE